MIINGEEHNDLCVGIDLGTTNSVLAVAIPRANGNIVSKVVGIDRAVDMYGRDASARFTIKNEETLPSCVYYNEAKNFMPVVGNYAKSRFSTLPHLVVKSIKSQMGNAIAEGISPDIPLSLDIPDKTPAQISARILGHMLRNAAKIYRQKEITDAVITVPASFDSIMCQATLEAARLAGIQIYNKDGSLRTILLPEPQAVIYDFINQVHNGEISDKILDLSTPKKVLVFDLGGGTLDITLHNISRRKDAPEILNVEDLAINRYTLLGGDDFDLALAQAMFARYLGQYRAYPEIMREIKRKESSVITKLLNYAEDLKIRVSTDNSGELESRLQSDDAWGDYDEDYPVGGHISDTNYDYDDTFTVQELEDVWRKFMGVEYKFDDFKNLDAAVKKNGTLNIIFPILDVLKKCADKLGTDDFKIDAVIMNGGMSRFYMVIDRLKEFFGFDPIVALDPDKSVARGAAVYHYFLHKYDEKAIASIKNLSMPADKNPAPYINPVKTILPDSLYLRTQGDRYEEIIATGTELPHKSKIFTHFKLPFRAHSLDIPIARKNNDGSYVDIARGKINFPEKYSAVDEETFVAFTVTMDEQKIIRMDAYTCSDAEGLNRMDDGTVEIAIATNLEKAEIAVKIQKRGILLKPHEVLNNILDFCKKIDKAQNPRRSDPMTIKKYSALVRREKMKIWEADNPEDFAEPLLKLFSDNANIEVFKMNCAIIGRKIGGTWSEAQKRRLANLCMQQLEREIYFTGYVPSGWSVNTKIQAIYTLSMCGTDGDLEKLRKLHSYSKFGIANLYTHAVTKTDVDWIYEEFRNDYRLVMENKKSHVQNSAHSLGYAYRLSDGRPIKSALRKSQFVAEICELILSKNLNGTEMNSCLLAIGFLCDRRFPNDIGQKSIDEAHKMLNELDLTYDNDRAFLDKFEKSKIVAQKMIQGGKLSAEEEEILLIKLDD